MGFFEGLTRAYGQFDKNVMGGMLPGGADSSSIGSSREVPYTSRKEAVQRAQKRSAMKDLPIYGGGGGSGNILNNDPGLSEEPSALMQNVQKAENRGLINIPTVIPAVEGPLKFLKSKAGILGKPFNVRESFIGRKDKFDDEINRGSYDKEAGTISYGLNDPGYKAPQGLKEELERGVFGAWLANVNKKTGAVTITETPTSQPYDTNGDAQYFQDKWDKAKKEGNIGGMIESGFYGNYQRLQELGLTNTAPAGTEPQLIGYVDPNTGKAIDGPFNSDFENVISEPQSRPAPEIKAPASSNLDAYEVQSGDSLTAISKRTGVSLDDLVRFNDIANQDLINVGSKLKLTN